MTRLTGDFLSDSAPVALRHGGVDVGHGKCQSASFADSGPVAFSGGGLDAVQRELPHAFAHLSAIGATLVSVEPPMWVHDGCEEVADFIAFAEREIAGEADPAWAKLDNPGAYALQERFGIPKADADGLRRELGPLSSLMQRLTGAESGFLEASTGWAGTAPVKRYRQGAGDDLPEVARIGDARVLALERLHVDRNRSAEDSDSYRNPMRLTLILSYDETGGTYFPYAELFQECPGVESLPTVLDGRSTSTHAGAEAAWPARDLSNRGVLVRGRRGRLLVFASSLGDRRAPLYSSLHQGVLLQPANSAGSVASRMVSVFGAHGDGQYETSAFHECLDHESIETRAEFFGRTEEEEATGILMTANSTRHADAYEFLQRRAELRRTTIEAIIQEELQRNPGLAMIPQVPMVTPAVGTSSASVVVGESAVVSDGAAVGDRTIAGGSAVVSGESMPALPDKIYWREACSVCLSDLRQPGDAASECSEKAAPGYLACGHVLCQDCFEGIVAQIFRAGRGAAGLVEHMIRTGQGCAICPECRHVSMQAWRPLLVDGEWIAGARTQGLGEPELREGTAAAEAPSRVSDVAGAPGRPAEDEDAPEVCRPQEGSGAAPSSSPEQEWVMVPEAAPRAPQAQVAPELTAPETEAPEAVAPSEAAAPPVETLTAAAPSEVVHEDAAPEVTVPEVTVPEVQPGGAADGRDMPELSVPQERSSAPELGGPS